MSQMHKYPQIPTGRYPLDAYPAIGPKPYSGQWRVRRTLGTEEVVAENNQGAGWKITAVVDESSPAPRFAQEGYHNPERVRLVLHGTEGSMAVTLDAAHALGIEVEA